MNPTKRWTGYYDAVDKQPPRDTVIAAVDFWEAEPTNVPGFAIDLGCGSGRDTHELLRRGWHVLAIDREAEGIRRLKRATPPEFADLLTTQVAPFEGLTLPSSQLINASFSLPFCPPQHFDALWDEIVHSIQPGGLFAGQIFGNNDSWANQTEMTFHTRAQFEERFVGFEIVELKEVDEDATTATGKEKHWHYFAVVARKV